MYAKPHSPLMTYDKYIFLAHIYVLLCLNFFQLSIMKAPTMRRLYIIPVYVKITRPCPLSIDLMFRNR